MKNIAYNLKRTGGYLLGFVLFYEPFMMFNKIAGTFITDTSFSSIHVPCARIPLANIVTGEWLAASPISLLFCLLLAVTSLWFGPLFCGKLCPAGGFSEFLGSLLPKKHKIDWAKLVPILPLRYGFFVGFLFSVWLGFGVPCTYCNYYSLEIFVNLFITGHLLNNLASLIATFFLANVFLGLFTKGGRGYCLFLCPVGTYNSLFHIMGRYLPGAFAMQINKVSCVGCTKCTQKCPMRAITMQDNKAQINRKLCIICGKCAHSCPKQAICYQSNLQQEDKYHGHND